MAQDGNFAQNTLFEPRSLRAFLMQHPEFVRHDSELLAHIAGSPTQSADKIISIDTLARERALKEKRRAEAQISEVIETARINYENQMRAQEAILAVLDARTPDELGDILSNHVAFALAADACVLAISASDDTSEMVDRVGSMIERLVPANRPVHMGKIDTNRPWAYGPLAQSLQSEALMRIEFGPHHQLAILAIASLDENMFKAEYGAELVRFFGQVLARVLSRFVADGLI